VRRWQHGLVKDELAPQSRLQHQYKDFSFLSGVRCFAASTNSSMGNGMIDVQTFAQEATRQSLSKRERKKRSAEFALKSIKVAIIGRPNVGKSTIFNRLVGKTRDKAIVSNVPGTTRDRREGLAQIGELTFTLTDTGGFEDASKYEDSFLAGKHGPALLEGMLRQTGSALKESDAILMVVDAQQGIVPEDYHFAKWVRRQIGYNPKDENNKIILLANKAEGLGDAYNWEESVDEHWNMLLMDTRRLGFGVPIPFSAQHGHGMGDLYNALEPYAMVPLSDVQQQLITDNVESKDNIRIAMIGRPNVGKSTLLNALVGSERVITGPVAGLTRDNITVDWTYEGRKFTLVDTAGIRKRTKLYGQNSHSVPTKGQNIQGSAKTSDASLEDMSITDSLRALDYSQVVVFVVDIMAQKDDPDARGMLTKHDLSIIGRITEEGRALIIAANKCDLSMLASREQTEKSVITSLQDQISDTIPAARGAKVVPISALHEIGTNELMPTLIDTYDKWNTRIPTGKLNGWLREAVANQRPPGFSGIKTKKYRVGPLKIKYATQIAARPPTFALFVNRRRPNSDTIPEPYLRYLTNSLREKFSYQGIPIRISIRGSTGSKITM